MKVARVFAVVFGILGLVLMLGTAVMCFASMDAPVRAEVPQMVKDCAEDFLSVLSQGDLTGAAGELYGQPDLGTDRALTEEAAAVWQIFCSGISCELTSEYYVSGSSFAVDAVITVPDIASITDTVKAHAQAILNDRIAVAEKMNELYDENGDFRQDLIDEVLAGAVELAFAEEPEVLRFETTLGFAYRENRWWVVPDGALMRALSGGLA